MWERCGRDVGETGEMSMRGREREREEKKGGMERVASERRMAILVLVSQLHCMHD